MVTIRMYNVGLGDCFLLRFDAQRPYFMLIDCGLFRSSDAEKETLLATVADIADTTNGFIDVVVATHEHQDHLSGFTYAQPVFREKNLRIGQVWLAWTEDPADRVATDLREGMNSFAEQLDKTVTQLKADTRRDFSRTSLGAVESVMEFIGLGEMLGATRGPGINQQALDFLKTFPVSYKKPNDVLQFPGQLDEVVPNVRFYVLGPPRNEFINQSNPSRNQPEVYHFGGAERHNYSLMTPAWSGEEDDKDRIDMVPFEKTHYGHVADESVSPYYYKPDEAYRRIDDDWLFAVGDLALKLDGDTNNTSLVLAIELIDSGKVLLFPGDAQVGNWLSWDDCKWEGHDGLTAEKLLNQTVFYKVGHHGSHNATLQAKGLERMSNDLVAMIPVDRDFAQKTKGWEMPFGKLHTRLLEKTKGRVLIADSRFPHTKNEKRPATMTVNEWRAFRKSVKQSTQKRPTTKNTDQPLWTEFILQ